VLQAVARLRGFDIGLIAGLVALLHLRDTALAVGQRPLLDTIVRQDVFDGLCALHERPRRMGCPIVVSAICSRQPDL
jgi:hypothetical protein